MITVKYLHPPFDQMLYMHIFMELQFNVTLHYKNVFNRFEPNSTLAVYVQIHFGMFCVLCLLS